MMTNYEIVNATKKDLDKIDFNNVDYQTIELQGENSGFIGGFNNIERAYNALKDLKRSDKEFGITDKYYFTYNVGYDGKEYIFDITIRKYKNKIIANYKK